MEGVMLEMQTVYKCTSKTGGPWAAGGSGEGKRLCWPRHAGGCSMG